MDYYLYYWNISEIGKAGVVAGIILIGMNNYITSIRPLVLILTEYKQRFDGAYKNFYIIIFFFFVIDIILKA